MRLLDFENHFLKTRFSFSLVINKKPNILLKQYLLKTRLTNYVCFDFMAFLSLMQQITYFIQHAVLTCNPFVFFIEDIWQFPLLRETIWRCNELLCHMPGAYSSINSWNPNILTNYKVLNFPKLYVSGIALSVSTINYIFFMTLLNKGWPCIVSTAVTLQPSLMKKSFSFYNSSYIIPSAQTANVKEIYFNTAYLSKIIQVEKYRYNK